MVAAGPDPDDTVRVRASPGTRTRRRPGLAAGLAVVLLLVFGIAAWLLMRPAATGIGTATEAQIDAEQPCEMKISRFAADPAIVVVDFPSLTIQGLTLNRVAALVEKANLPRDRVLNDVELNEAITDCGDTIESYYYGHDYKAADLARFFTLAGQENIQLNSHELWLKTLLARLGWLAAGANGALITLPAAIPPISQEMREVILHHELSHGAFYTEPAYAAYATAFWNSLTATDRADFTGFLGREGYDTGNTDLMLNETQAYLIFTTDPAFFNAAAVDMTPAQIATLRAGYIANIPTRWLQPMANAALPIVSAPGGGDRCQVN